MNAIHVSGGIDSLAMLYWLRPVWDDSVVMWCNSGAAYPSSVQMMERIARIVPRFRTVYANQPEVIRRCGFPVDVVPVKYSLQGDVLYGAQAIRFQSYYDCCRQVIWEPLHRASWVMGVDTIYRGQRKDDVRRAPIQSGDADPYGVRVIFPIHDWTREQCIDYIKRECPELWCEYYDTEKTSRDCWDCTAYRDDNIERVRNLPEEQRTIVEKRLELWRRAVVEEMSAGG